ncbi:hypothetical protein NE237_003653 [Protea cynaroides]|uniref:Uncharacterized protein n=1 Tax=Protea cynaroides TaxID=273540 RepID=A0A9Q0KHW0_9MAGN|nr:hypothetical protein NE237_003653 [Protea cynaroides]
MPSSLSRISTPQPALNHTLVRNIKDPLLTISAVVFSLLISLCLVPGFDSIALLKSEQHLFSAGHPGLGKQLLACLFLLNSLLILLTIQSLVGMLVTVRLISKWKKKLEEEEEEEEEELELQARMNFGHLLVNLDDQEDSLLRDVQLVRFVAFGATVLALICLLLTVASMCWVSMEDSLFLPASPSFVELEESSKMLVGNRMEALLLVMVVILLAFVNGSFPAFIFLSKWAKERGTIHPHQFQV